MPLKDNCKMSLLSCPSVRQILHLEDPDNPVLRGVGFLQNIQLKVFIADLGISHSVISRWLTSFCVNLAKAIVAHLVHHAVQQSWGALPVHPEFSRRGVIVVLLDVLSFWSAATDTDHPQEFVDVIGRISCQSSKNDQNIINVQLFHDLVSLVLCGSHGLANPGYVGVVPGVVIHYDCSVRHCRDLITIIPPGHHFCILWSVLSEPPVGFPKVIKDNPSTIVASGAEHNTRGAVSLTRHPSTVESVCDEEEGHLPTNTMATPSFLGYPDASGLNLPPLPPAGF